MSYEIRDGKIQTSLCELNVVHHCNLSCRACSHLSPMAKKFFVNPDQVLKDFSVLAKYCHPQHIRLGGGEPLLHPNLLAVIAAVRESGISECIRVVTNGVLLGRMPDMFWQCVDQIHISLYPGSRISTRKLKIYRQRAEKNEIKLEVSYFDRFREPYSTLGTKDSDLIRRIFSTCQIAHAWCCQAVYQGYFYRCSPSIFIPWLLQGGTEMNTVRDGLKLASNKTFADDLHKFLLAQEPLEACKYCLGTVGKRFAHVQESHQGQRTPLPTEELIDWKYLRYFEATRNICIPPWLQRAGVPVKKAFIGTLHLVREHLIV